MPTDPTSVRLSDEAIERPADPQYGDMQGAELAAARTDPHLSACDEPVFDHCPLCVRARDRIRTIVAAAAPLLVEAGRREVLDGARVEWGVRVLVPHPARPFEKKGHVNRVCEKTARHAAGLWHGWETVRRQVLDTGWQAVQAGDTTP